MRCTRCGVENDANSKFCNQCATPLNRACPKCGRLNAPDAKFCAQCAAALGPAGAKPEPASRPLTLRESDDATAMHGERKTVTALFADIKGSMDLMEDIDPEEARAIVDPALKLMIDAVRRYDGYIVQSTGDGIFAIFGAPAAHEDHPQRSLYAALRIQDEMQRYSTRLREAGHPPIEARVGVNTGEVVVRSIKTDDAHTEYTPIGHSMSLASRMQALAPIGSIATTEQVRKLCEGYFLFKSLGPTRVKGVTEQVHVHEVTGLGPLRTPLQRAARRGLTKFVGRQPEMDAMRNAAELAKGGHGQIVAAVAEAGIGKSRLFYEFRARHQSGWSVLEAFSVSHGKASIYLPVIGLLNTYFGIDSSDDTRKRREKVNGKILTLDRALEDTLPYLYGLLELSEGNDPLAQMDGQTRRRRTLDAIRRIVLCESLNLPLMIIFEDLHWIDSETQALLNLLTESIGSSKVLFLVNYRPEYRHEWGNQASYTQLRLQPLESESATEMLTALLGDAEEVQSLRRLIMESTGGNPFFIEETIQELFEEGALVRNGQVKMTRSPSQLQIPPNVQAILASRIDRLPADEKQLLQTLAIIGNEFQVRLVTEVSGQPDSVIIPMLAELEKREFIFEQLIADDIQYNFKHALTHDVAASLMLTDKRKALHERTAQAIESLFADRLDAHVNQLAHHYSNSANIAKAMKYLTLAGQQASQRSAYLEAISNLKKGLDLLKTLPETPERDRQELALQTALGPSLMEAKGDASPETEAAYSRGAALSEKLGETSGHFWSQEGLFLSYMVGGQLQTAQEIAKHLLDLAKASNDRDQLFAAHGFFGIGAFWLGDLAVASSHFDQSLAHFDPPRQRHIAFRHGMDFGAGFTGYSALPLWMLGYPDKSIQRTQRALAIAQERSHVSSVAMALAHAAGAHTMRRDPQQARRMAEAGIALSTEHGFPLWAAACKEELGVAAIQSGEEVKGIPLLEEGLKAVEATGLKVGVGRLRGTLALAYAKTGRSGEGLRLIEDALASVRVSGELSSHLELQRMKGELLLLQDVTNAAEAESCFRSAVEHAQRHGAKSFELRATLSLAHLLENQGKRDEARAILAEIYGWFTEGFDTADLKDAKAFLDELSA